MRRERKYRGKQLFNMLSNAPCVGVELGEKTSEAINVVVGLPVAVVANAVKTTVACDKPSAFIQGVREDASTCGVGILGIGLGSMLLKYPLWLGFAAASSALSLLYTPYYLISRNHYDLCNDELSWFLNEGKKYIDRMDIPDMGYFLKDLEKKYQINFRSSSNSKQLFSQLGLQPRSYRNDEPLFARSGLYLINDDDSFSDFIPPFQKNDLLNHRKTKLKNFIDDFKNNAGSRLYQTIYHLIFTSAVLEQRAIKETQERTFADVDSVIKPYLR